VILLNIVAMGDTVILDFTLSAFLPMQAACDALHPRLADP
jgi:hypothetical protein